MFPVISFLLKSQIYENFEPADAAANPLVCLLTDSPSKIAECVNRLSSELSAVVMRVEKVEGQLSDGPEVMERVSHLPPGFIANGP